VAQAMQEFDTVPAHMPLTEAAALMRSHHGRALVVDTGEESPAIFTEYDIVKVVGSGESLEGKTVGDHHTHIAIAATPDWSLDRAIDTMMRGQFRHLVVMENGQTVGMIAMRDILEAILEPSEHEATEAGTTVELAAHVAEDAGRLLHNLRRSAKQHLVAAKCDCELDWIEVVIGQAEERPDLTREELQVIWDRRHPCPTLNAMGGGGD
jgi:signal-transduction protein with cAMP-binding, CBS, and nucleotidyltransferase domain